MTLPNDPDKVISYYMHAASSQVLLDMFDFLTEIQTFGLEKLYPIGTPEYKAAADTLETVKKAVLIKQGYVAHKANSLLE